MKLLILVFLYLPIIFAKHKKTPIDNNVCEIKFFEEPNFEGDSMGITRGEFIYSLGFTEVKSFQIIGPCCWEIFRY